MPNYRRQRTEADVPLTFTAQHLITSERPPVLDLSYSHPLIPRHESYPLVPESPLSGTETAQTHHRAQGPTLGQGTRTAREGNTASLRGPSHHTLSGKVIPLNSTDYTKF